MTIALRWLQRFSKTSTIKINQQALMGIIGMLRPALGDGLTRRQMICGGLAGIAGLSLPQLLSLQAQSAEMGASKTDAAVIYVLQEGGAPQHETWDPKPRAPVEVRGAFEAIGTKIPGVQFCELMPEQAKNADKLTILRSIHHPSTQHSSSVHLKASPPDVTCSI